MTSSEIWMVYFMSMFALAGFFIGLWIISYLFELILNKEITYNVGIVLILVYGLIFFVTGAITILITEVFPRTITE